MVPMESKQIHILVTRNSNDDKQNLPLVVTYSTFGKPAVCTLKNNSDNALKDTVMGRSFRIIPVYRKNPNLQQLLVRAKLPPANQSLQKTNLLTVARNPTTGHVFKFPQHIPRTQSNCIYIIKCALCGKLYVGETRNALTARLTQHKYVILTRTGTSSHLVGHF